MKRLYLLPMIVAMFSLSSGAGVFGKIGKVFRGTGIKSGCSSYCVEQKGLSGAPEILAHGLRCMLRDVKGKSHRPCAGSISKHIRLATDGNEISAFSIAYDAFRSNEHEFFREYIELVLDDLERSKKKALKRTSDLYNQVRKFVHNGRLRRLLDERTKTFTLNAGPLDELISEAREMIDEHNKDENTSPREIVPEKMINKASRAQAKYKIAAKELAMWNRMIKLQSILKNVVAITMYNALYPQEKSLVDDNTSTYGVVVGNHPEGGAIVLVIKLADGKSQTALNSMLYLPIENMPDQKMLSVGTILSNFAVDNIVSVDKAKEKMNYYFGTQAFVKKILKNPSSKDQYLVNKKGVNFSELISGRPSLPIGTAESIAAATDEIQAERSAAAAV